MIIKKSEKIPISEIYDGELIEAISTINAMINDIAELMYNREPYEDWEYQYQMHDELILFAEMIRENQENA